MNAKRVHGLDPAFVRESVRASTVHLKRIALVLALLMINGCAPSESRGLSLSDERIREQMQSKMKSLSIPFREDSDGTIWYPSRNSQKVNELLTDLYARMNAEIGHRVPDASERALIEGILDERKIRYREERIDGVDWIFWIPENHEQQSEVALEIGVRWRSAQVKPN